MSRSRSLAEFLGDKTSPLVVYLELTHRCSFLCQHCYIPENLRWPKSKMAGDLTTDEVMGLMEQLRSAGALFLIFTGGEIFLRPDLMELTEKAVELGFVVKYYTNGFHLNENNVERIRDLGVYSVEISLYGASEATYQRVTKVKGGFERVLTGIRLLKAAGVRFTLKAPIMTLNVQELAAMKKIADGFGSALRYDFVIIPRFDGDDATTQLRCSEEQIHGALRALGAKFEPKNSEKAPACSVGRWSAVVSPEGDVLPCIELRHKLGNVRQRAFAEIWQNNPYLSTMRKKLDRMERGRQEFTDGLCGHCPALSLSEEGDMNKTSTEHLRIAAVKRQFVTREVGHAKK